MRTSLRRFGNFLLLYFIYAIFSVAFLSPAGSDCPAIFPKSVALLLIKEKSRRCLMTNLQEDLSGGKSSIGKMGIGRPDLKKPGPQRKRRYRRSKCPAFSAAGKESASTSALRRGCMRHQRRVCGGKRLLSEKPSAAGISGEFLLHAVTKMVLFENNIHRLAEEPAF